MATPIPLDLPPRDPRAELRGKLENAPLDHAEALLSVYEILQGLQDKGMLDTVRGAIGSSDKILQMMVDASKTPEAIRGMRNLIIMAKLGAALDPDLLNRMAKTIPDTLANAQTEEPLGLWQLLKKLRSKDSRRALTAMTKALESMGKALAPGENIKRPD